MAEVPSLTQHWSTYPDFAALRLTALIQTYLQLLHTACHTNCGGALIEENLTHAS